MMRARQQSRFLAGLLAVAVFVSQTSIVLASFEMYPASDSSTRHCMMNNMTSDANSANSQDQLAGTADCCETSDCADNYCVPGFSFSSSALFNSITLLHCSVYTQTTIETSDQLQSGTVPSSLYRPPRSNA